MFPLPVRRLLFGRDRYASSHCPRYQPLLLTPRKPDLPFLFTINGQLRNALKYRSEITGLSSKTTTTHSAITDGFDEITNVYHLYFSLRSEEIVGPRKVALSGDKKLSVFIRLESRTPDKWFIYLNRRFHSPSRGNFPTITSRNRNNLLTESASRSSNAFVLSIGLEIIHG